MATIGKKVVSISVLVYFNGNPIEATAKKLITAFITKRPLLFHLLSMKNATIERLKANKKYTKTTFQMGRIFTVSANSKA